MTTRSRWIGGACALALVAWPGAAGATHTTAHPTLTSGPDLGMAAPRDVDLRRSGDRRLLRYTAQVANVGTTELRLVGAHTSGYAAVQDVPGVGTFRINSSMSFAGDGHAHWHLGDLELGELVRLDNGVKVGTLAKHGFCFYDTTAYRLSLPGAPSSGAFRHCDGDDDADTTVTMGLSIGWSDVYPSTIAFQYIDVTGLAPGRYRLKIGVNPALAIRERNYDNNSSWADIQLKQNSVRVVATGPSI